MDYENKNENSEAAYHLEELSNSDYEIKDGEPDIIGWDVRNSAGNKIGEVDELIFDPQARKVRYLVLNMEGNEADLEDDRRVLIPIGVAQLHTEEDDVILPASSLQLSGLPPYENCPLLTPELEMQTRQVFEGSSGSTAPYAHPQFYEHAHFNEDQFYGRGNLPEGEAARAGRIVDRINRDNPDEPTSGAVL